MGSEYMAEDYPTARAQPGQKTSANWLNYERLHDRAGGYVSTDSCKACGLDVGYTLCLAQFFHSGQYNGERKAATNRPSFPPVEYMGST